MVRIAGSWSGKEALFVYIVFFWTVELGWLDRNALNLSFVYMNSIPEVLTYDVIRVHVHCFLWCLSTPTISTTCVGVSNARNVEDRAVLLLQHIFAEAHFWHDVHFAWCCWLQHLKRMKLMRRVDTSQFEQIAFLHLFYINRTYLCFAEVHCCKRVCVRSVVVRWSNASFGAN